MRVALVSYGSAGDTRPLVALALGLTAAGHEAVLIGEQAGAPLAKAHGVTYHALSGDIRALMGPGGSLALAVEAGRLTLASSHAHHNPERAWLEKIRAASVGADVVVGFPAATYHALSVARDLGAVPIIGNLQPMHPTREFASSGLGNPRLPRALNSPVGRLVLVAGWAWLGRQLNRARRELGPPPTGDPTSGVRVLGGWSPTLVPQPRDWPAERFTVAGHWTLPDAAWSPDPELAIGRCDERGYRPFCREEHHTASITTGPTAMRTTRAIARIVNMCPSSSAALSTTSALDVNPLSVRGRRGNA